MYDQEGRLSLLLDLEARQDDLLARLEELDRRVQQALIQFQTEGDREPAPAEPKQKPLAA